MSSVTSSRCFLLQATHAEASPPSSEHLTASCCSDVPVYTEGHLILVKILIKQFKVANSEADLVSINSFFCRKMIHETKPWAAWKSQHISSNNSQKMTGTDGSSFKVSTLLWKSPWVISWIRANIYYLGRVLHLFEWHLLELCKVESVSKIKFNFRFH